MILMPINFDGVFSRERNGRKPKNVMPGNSHIIQEKLVFCEPKYHPVAMEIAGRFSKNESQELSWTKSGSFLENGTNDDASFREHRNKSFYDLDRLVAIVKHLVEHYRIEFLSGGKRFRAGHQKRFRMIFIRPLKRLPAKVYAKVRSTFWNPSSKHAVGASNIQNRFAASEHVENRLEPRGFRLVLHSDPIEGFELA